MIKLSLPDQLKLVPYLFSCPAAGSLTAGLPLLCTYAALSIGLLGPDPWDNSTAPHLSGLFVQFVSSPLAWFWDHTRSVQGAAGWTVSCVYLWESADSRVSSGNADADISLLIWCASHTSPLKEQGPQRSLKQSFKELFEDELHSCFLSAKQQPGKVHLCSLYRKASVQILGIGTYRAEPICP